MIRLISIIFWLTGLYQKHQTKSQGTDSSEIHGMRILVLNICHSFKILRRRIAWIIGHWIGVKIDKQYRNYVYQIMLQLLAPEEDMVVRLVAANNLRNCVDDWDFETDDFVPYIEPSIQLLTALLKDVEEFDSRMRILSCLNIVIDRVESRVSNTQV